MRARGAPAAARRSALHGAGTARVGAALVLSACAGASDGGADPAAASSDAAAEAAAGPEPAVGDADPDATPADVEPEAAAPAPAPAPEPAPDPGYVLPEDWEARALAAAEAARAGVVAIGWKPPGIVRRRIEAGWLIAPDLVVTSPDVACEAQLGEGLRVRTLAGEFRGAAVDEVVGTCSARAPGVALLRLERPVDAPPLTLRDGPAPQEREPLLAIGHPNTSAAVGAWMVLVGPVIDPANAQGLLWADIGAPVSVARGGEFFGGGFNGAPLIDLDGRVVSVLCCERDWGPQVNLRSSPIAAPVLRSRLVLDEPYYVGGPTPDELRGLLAEHVAAGGRA